MPRVAARSMSSKPKAQSPKSAGGNIVLGVTGSIAAYKAADLTSRLVREEADVHVVMTADAMRFITPLPFKTLSQNPVVTDLYDEEEGWKPTHIRLADEADLLLIAPATANILAKMAHGIADDALTCIVLALNLKAISFLRSPDWFKLPRWLSSHAPDTGFQAARIQFMERNIVLPVKATVLVLLAYYLFFSKWFEDVYTYREAVLLTVRLFFLIY